MTREIITITSEEQWLELREADITSTMSPALFDLSPYLTVFELYHAKKSGVHVPFQSNERIEAGRDMEQYAARKVGKKLGMEVRPFKDYVRIPGDRMASSFDWEILHPDLGWGILEIKAVDFFQHKEKWSEEIPPHIEIQLQHQLECADRHSWGMIAAFTGIYDFHEYRQARDPEFGAGLRAAVKKFWADVEAGIEPQPDFYRDGSVIDELYRGANGPADLNLTEDFEFEAMLSKYSRLKGEEKAVQADLSALKAQIHSRIANDTGAFTERYKLTAGWTKDTVGTLVTPEMVGTHVGPRKGYRQLLITDLTTKKGKNQ
ncbi:MAG: YqaJ viral recombinase family protein [Janthinobacterium lividum]